MSPIWLVVVLLAILALAVLAAGVRGLRRRRFGRGGTGVLIGAVLATSAFATGAAAWSLGRFHALTHETTAATVRIEPLERQRFRAVVDTGDEAPRTFELRGDQLWIDARIVKWHPSANLMGLHTAYRLERIGGRYESLDDERTAPRTVHALEAADSAGRMFDWASDRAWLRPLVEAEYGSGTFAAARSPRTLQVRVSTSGLLIREVPSVD